MFVCRCCLSSPVTHHVYKLSAGFTARISSRCCVTVYLCCLLCFYIAYQPEWYFNVIQYDKVFFDFEIPYIVYSLYYELLWIDVLSEFRAQQMQTETKYIRTYMGTFIHSFCSLSYDRFIVSSKSSFPQNAVCCFLFQFPVSSRFRKVIQ